ncbi:MAG: NAD(+)/NADH kinase [Clostridia bacterium]|nr:NAD(+)/NADH kinase [Clostridia bacterium]
MKVGIYLNEKYFSENKQYIDRILTAFSSEFCKVVKSVDGLDGLEILFVLGGDGTILTVASECAKRRIKIIGINYGHLGFLAEFEPDRLDDAIALVKSGSYKVQSRSMLKISTANGEYVALNDLVIQRSTGGVNFINTVSLHAEIDGTTVDNFSSDGIIVSTPTGSTAYSLSAGGSVLTPDIGAFILTPICPHSLHSRPVVFGDNSVLRISPVNAGAPLGLIVDGKAVGEVGNGEEVTVSKSEFKADFITSDDKNFFSKLLIKLNIWSK